MCTLCRVPLTNEHVASGWHKFNQNLYDSGRMPIAEANYNLYGTSHTMSEVSIETHLREVRTSRLHCAQATNLDKECLPLHNSIEKQRLEGVAHHNEEEKRKLEGNKRNVNQWHWEESDYTTWAKQFLTKGIKKIRIDVPEGGDIRITDVSKFSGDAIVNMRKGRTFATYDFDLVVDFKAKVKDFDSKGSVVIPEISSNNKDDLEITNLKIEGNDCAERSAALKAFRAEFVSKLTAVVEAFEEQIQKIVKDPSSYEPPHGDSSESEADSSSDEEEEKENAKKEGEQSPKPAESEANPSAAASAAGAAAGAAAEEVASPSTAETPTSE